MSKIEVKPKPCKGTGKAKDFDGCKLLNVYRTYGLCNICYARWLTSTPEGKEKLSKAIIKVSKPRIDLEVAIKEKKESRSLGHLLINTRKVCHDFIKLRDKGKPCVSCDGLWSADHQAGHWKKAELFSTLKFDEKNIHGQCRKCNLIEDGNVQVYGTKIHHRIGIKGKQELEMRAILDRQIDFKWDREELIKIRDYYKAKTKKLNNAC